MALFLLLAACQSQPGTPATATPDPPETAIPSAAPSPSPIPLPPRTRAYYALSLVLDYDEKSVSVQESIIYPNLTGGPLNTLVLAVEPNLWWDCFTLDELALNGTSTETYTLTGQRLEIPLPQALQPETEMTIALDYRLDLPHIKVNKNAVLIREQLFGHTQRQLNLVDWYPFVVPYIPEEGWLLHEPNPYGEHLVYDKYDFEVTVNFAEGSTVPVVAASGGEAPAQDGKRFTLENARNFALSFSPDFILHSQEFDSVTVNSYNFPIFDLAGQAALEASGQSLVVLSDLFAAYPHDTLSVVQCETDFSMEYDGFYLLNRELYTSYGGAPNDFLPVIAVHETAHQWWFGLVGNDQALQPWLDEALSTYSERLYYEVVDPPKADWWEAARLRGYDPQYWVDTRIYDFGRYYMPAVYFDGADFLHALRQRVGDEAFFAFLKDYAAQYAGARASAADFFGLLRQHTAEDFSDLLEKYFHDEY